MDEVAYNPLFMLDTLVAGILRPFRCLYSLGDLGRKTTPHYTRTDTSLLNPRNQRIFYSYYSHTEPSTTCIIYCHCNSGSRVEALPYLDLFIAKGWNALYFDFTGSGLSDGETISLGHHEAIDLECVVAQARCSGNTKILLWGRSMGASTILLYLGQTRSRENIVGCVVDSPYTSLWSLLRRVVGSHLKLPGFIIDRILQSAREKIKKEKFFDIQSLLPEKYMASIDIPLLVIASEKDEFVGCEQIVQLFSAASSKIKQLEWIDKPHNSTRDPQTIMSAVAFLHEALQERAKKTKKLRIFKKYNKEITGSNMADLIIQAERLKEKLRNHSNKPPSLLKKIKSYSHLRKENTLRLGNIKTELDELADREIDENEPPLLRRVNTSSCKKPFEDE